MNSPAIGTVCVYNYLMRENKNVGLKSMARRMLLKAKEFYIHNFLL